MSFNNQPNISAEKMKQKKTDNQKIIGLENFKIVYFNILIDSAA